uniref:Smith-Magenis syndrome chromosome region, candidate 8b n=1 Tax=Myripristis murdjan TaxID=586833 RepID=A0A667WE24_9TELE
MIGSPDLLAFTGAGGFGEGVDDQETQPLPEELSIPPFPPSNPWHTTAKFHRDFILVAEFSEQVGPKPVLTIPDGSGVIGSFDLNHFSVRIMSVDYQASCPGPATSASPGPRLNFSEDSKVILGDSADDAFAYVHHMTLYDLEARGLVRPFCMAYVTSDQAKLTEHFSELSTCFSQAADSLKTGNRRAFVQLCTHFFVTNSMQLPLNSVSFRTSPHNQHDTCSILQHHHALFCRYTHLVLQREAELQRTAVGLTEVGEKDSELAAVERSILEHRDLLRQVTSYPNRKLKQPDFLPYDPADSLSDSAGLLTPELSPSPSSSSSCRSTRDLKPLEELSDAYFLSLTMEQLRDTERRLCSDRSVLHTARVTHFLSRRLTLTNFLFELWSPEDDVEEEDERETAEAELQGERGGTSGVEALPAEQPSLESFYSCVEEIPIKLEAGEVGTVTPDPEVAMEMTGSMSSGDSIEVLGTEKSYRTQHVVTGSDSRGMTLYLRRVRASARRANSEDSIEVLSTTESIFPDDLTAITEEEAEPQWSDVRYRVTKPLVLPDLSVNLAPAMSLAEVSQWSPSCTPLRSLSIDEASDCTGTSPCSSEPPSLTSSLHGNPRLDKRRRRRAGLRALRFLQQNSFSQHAVFCLLSGRPLVVIGGDKNSVRKLVDALTLFLPAPGPNGNAVLPCLTTPLQLNDLLTWRLIGVHRSPSSSLSSVLHSLARYSRYLAVLDLDQRTLRCPSYSGSLVSKVADPHSICRGSTYLLHLESGLTALTNQALLYTFNPAFHQPNLSSSDDIAQRKHFLFELGFCSSENDFRIIYYLSDLIKQRHAGCGPPVLSFSYSSVHNHRNSSAT